MKVQKRGMPCLSYQSLYLRKYTGTTILNDTISRLTILSREVKKKQAVCDE